ncbi:DMT family transporter [Eubacterium limosum]|uniref:DMT family transporter n=1 Tax=Eubacterium limosum TaxID=1736 RepID=UPI003717928E
MSRFKRCGILLLAVVLFALDNILLKALPEGTSPFGVLTLSCGLAAPILTLCFKKRLRKKIEVREHVRIFLMAGGFTLFNTLNILSLRYLGVNDSSFIFSLTVALVPIFNLFLGKRYPLSTWLGVAIIVGGVWFASGAVYNGDELWGGVLSFLGAVVRAFFLIALNRASKKVDGGKMIVEIIWLVALFSALVWLVLDPGGIVSFGFGAKTLLPVLGFALLSIVIGNSMVILVQQYTTEVETAVILSVQLIFTVLFMAVVPAVFESPEPITMVNAFGCGLIVMGSILATCNVSGLLKRQRVG